MRLPGSVIAPTLGSRQSVQWTSSESLLAVPYCAGDGLRSLYLLFLQEQIKGVIITRCGRKSSSGRRTSILYQNGLQHQCPVYRSFSRHRFWYPTCVAWFVSNWHKYPFFQWFLCPDMLGFDQSLQTHCFCFNHTNFWFEWVLFWNEPEKKTVCFPTCVEVGLYPLRVHKRLQVWVHCNGCEHNYLVWTQNVLYIVLTFAKNCIQITLTTIRFTPCRVNGPLNITSRCRTRRIEDFGICGRVVDI